jgi:hypothetical protein
MNNQRTSIHFEEITRAETVALTIIYTYMI